MNTRYNQRLRIVTPIRDETRCERNRWRRAYGWTLFGILVVAGIAALLITLLFAGAMNDLFPLH